MKNFSIIFVLLVSVQWVNAQNLKPYILGFESDKSITVLAKEVKANMATNGLNVIGEYQPASDKNRYILVYTSPDLKAAVKTIGGLSGFAATQRVSLTIESGKTKVAYTTPAYWGNAYFQENFAKVATKYANLNKKLEASMKASGNFIGTPFGSEKGISAKDLQEYHYMMGMPYFEDTVELEDFDSYTAAVAKIDASVKSDTPNLKQIYKLTIPGKELTLYGFGLSGTNGESQFLPIIDGSSNPKHTAFLPYEVLVMGDEVHILHGRFRIALAFPDLTMGTFSKIMSTPGNIEEMLEQLVD